MAKDIFHSHVRSALEKDGWTITDDPLLLPWGTAPVYVDLGAEKIIAAEKNDSKIAVEVKSFLRGSRTEDLEDAMGQVVLYRYLLRRLQPERELFLAVRKDVYERRLCNGSSGTISRHHRATLNPTRRRVEAIRRFARQDRL
jgi:hypothetical protein